MSRSLAVAAALVLLLAAFLAWQIAPRLLPGLRRTVARPAPSLAGLSGLTAWWNATPAAGDSLSGHPVVLLLWSEADPRTEPALETLEAWHRAYAPLGVRVLAVHAPEYRFATDTAVTGRIVRRGRLTLPVASDPSGRLVTAFGGPTEGPHLVVLDERGATLVDTVGALAAGDEALRAWARAARGAAAEPPALAVPAPAPVRTVRLGAGQVTAGPLAGLPAGHEEVFTAQFRYQEQGKAWTPFPVGGWRLRADGLQATRGGAANFVAIRYSAARVGVVVSPPPGASARLWILVDDRWPREAERGADVAADSRGAAHVDVAAPGLYWIGIGQGTGERVLKLSPDQAGATLHAIVFENAGGGPTP
jgi:hypothetical protein